MRDKHEINCMNSLYTCIIYICVCVCARISIYIYTYIDNLSVHINATQKSIFKINICSLSSTMVAKLVPVDVPAVLLPQSLPGSIGFDHLDLWPLRSSSSSSPKCRARRPLKKKSLSASQSFGIQWNFINKNIIRLILDIWAFDLLLSCQMLSCQQLACQVQACQVAEFARSKKRSVMLP